MKDWRQSLRYDAVEALLAAPDAAVARFARRDFMDSFDSSDLPVRELAEPRRILARQLPDGSWGGKRPRRPTFPENHADLMATFKQFRTLVLRYELSNELAAVASAAEYLLTFQTGEGDIRGFIANQYATYYTGEVLALLIRAGYADDPRVERGMRWLLSMRQDDGGWTIPILTHHFDGKTTYRLTSSFEEAVAGDPAQPSSHNWTDMVLRAFAAHPVYRFSEEARAAGTFLKRRFFQPDVYSSYREARYWVRFGHWWPNLLTSMESLSLLGFPADDPDMRRGLEWMIENQCSDGLWNTTDSRGKAPSPSEAQERAWISLRMCRLLNRLSDVTG